MESLRRALAQSLERGQFSGAPARALERAWRTWSARRVVRPLRVPENVIAIAVGGATLGGSGKTPLALACARFALESCRGKVALIGHAYRAAPRMARAVTPDDDASVVGDEALLCARELARARASGKAPPDSYLDVIVAPTRQRAVDFAIARGARILVLDGVLQIAPRRADLALLALDADAPWGSSACPPCGDLKAPAPALLAACDRVVTLSRDSVRSRGAILQAPSGGPPRAADDARTPVPYEELARMKLGLFTALARPERVVRWLQSRGVFPGAVIHASDHGTVSAQALASAAATHRIDAWVTTHKCSIHMRNSSLLPVYVLEHRVELDLDLRQTFRSVIALRARSEAT